MTKLNAVVELLQSSKVKERQEGIISLKEAFSRDDVVLNLEEGRAWLVVYQALFTAVTSEKAECVKKAASGKNASTGAAALRRLGDATTTVRWLVERSNCRLTAKVLTPLLTHLLQMMVYRGQLYTPLALSYLKTSRYFSAGRHTWITSTRPLGSA